MRLAVEIARGFPPGRLGPCPLYPLSHPRNPAPIPIRRRSSNGYRLKSTITGTWSDGVSQSRASRTTVMPVRSGTRSGVIQTWSSLRPRLDFFQSRLR
ncbi:hypothetical protein FOH24_08485 [Acetobacter tropicalis]|nr:hypothetical protein FOH22_05365 [Acetobacter tropicalis]KAA8390874.1 hypothetical protein FOH24_08485 [Acetobacter tropicalis]